MIREVVFHPSTLPSMKTRFPKGEIPSLNSSSFSIPSFFLFPSQQFFHPSPSIILHSSTYFANTHFDFKIIFKTRSSQSVRHSFCEAGQISQFSNLKAHFHTFSINIYCMVFIVLLQLYLMTIVDIFLTLVEPSFNCCGL